MMTVARRKKKAWMTGEQLAAIREALGLTQVELAECLDLTSVMVSTYERGASPIPKPLAVLMKAARDGKIKLTRN